MIVFNMYAIVVAFFMALASLPLLLLYYFDIIGEELGLVLMSWVTLVVCLLCRKAEIDGRLFWIPMWILAIPTVPLVTYGFYGWTGIITTVSIFASLIALIFLLSFFMEKKRAKNITAERLDFTFDISNPVTSWKELQDKFFFPSYLKMTPEICAYNLRIIEKIESHDISLAMLPEFKDEMKYHSISMGDAKVNKDIVKRFSKEIDTRLEHFQKLHQTN